MYVSPPIWEPGARQRYGSDTSREPGQCGRERGPPTLPTRTSAWPPEPAALPALQGPRTPPSAGSEGTQALWRAVPAAADPLGKGGEVSALGAPPPSAPATGPARTPLGPVGGRRAAL